MGHYWRDMASDAEIDAHDHKLDGLRRPCKNCGLMANRHETVDGVLVCSISIFEPTEPKEGE